MTKALIAYPSGEAQKAAIIAELQDHAAHDRLVKGLYWAGGKGCAVGCTIKSDNHAEYEPRFGIPQMLARLEDAIFENLPNANAMKWPVQFMSAAPVGADLSLVGWQFLYYIVEESLRLYGTDQVREGCASALAAVLAKSRGEHITAYVAADAAYAAADAAYAAARAASAAARAAAADAAAYAAYAVWQKYASKLLELMAAAPVRKVAQ